MTKEFIYWPEMKLDEFFRYKSLVRNTLRAMAEGYCSIRIEERDGIKYINTVSGQKVCFWCQKVFEKYEVHRHHVIPRAAGGDSRPGDRVGLCRECAKLLEAHKDLYNPNRPNPLKVLIDSIIDEFPDWAVWGRQEAREIEEYKVLLNA